MWPVRIKMKETTIFKNTTFIANTRHVYADSTIIKMAAEHRYLH